MSHVLWMLLSSNSSGAMWVAVPGMCSKHRTCTIAGRLGRSTEFVCIVHSPGWVFAYKYDGGHARMQVIATFASIYSSVVVVGKKSLISCAVIPPLSHANRGSTCKHRRKWWSTHRRTWCAAVGGVVGLSAQQYSAQPEISDLAADRGPLGSCCRRSGQLCPWRVGARAVDTLHQHIMGIQVSWGMFREAAVFRVVVVVMVVGAQGKWLLVRGILLCCPERRSSVENKGSEARQDIKHP